LYTQRPFFKSLASLCGGGCSFPSRWPAERWRSPPAKPTAQVSQEPESKEESGPGEDPGVRVGRGPLHSRRSPICFGPGSPSPRGSPICFGPGSPSPRRSPIFFYSGVRVQGGARFGLDPRVRVQGGVRLALDSGVQWTPLG
jgi:hypothetical protein